MNEACFLRPEFSVFVGDLASEVDDFQLHQVFKKYLSCKGAKVVTDQYGYSRYVSPTGRLCFLGNVRNIHIGVNVWVGNITSKLIPLH